MLYSYIDDVYKHYFLTDVKNIYFMYLGKNT